MRFFLSFYLFIRNICFIFAISNIKTVLNNMKKQEEIEKIIQDKIDDLEYANAQPRMSEEYYDKNDSKIEVLQEILRLITY